MTREEAIKILETEKPRQPKKVADAFDVAIKALQDIDKRRTDDRNRATRYRARKRDES